MSTNTLWSYKQQDHVKQQRLSVAHLLPCTYSTTTLACVQQLPGEYDPCEALAGPHMQLVPILQQPHARLRPV